MNNVKVVLASRPSGIPGPEHFRFEEEPIRPLADDEILVRNTYLSVDPGMRGWVNAAANYRAPVAIGDVMPSYAVGEVVDSRHPSYGAGAVVVGTFGWQSYALVGAASVMRQVPDNGLPASTALGVLGINGITAYFGLLDVGQPKPGETVLVSTAAGSVGSVVGQIAKRLGCRTVGIAGGAKKVRQCHEDFGYDSVVDYRIPDALAPRIQAAAPDGVDVYFDNTSGPISDAVMPLIRNQARVVVCGTSSIKDWNSRPLGPRVERHLLTKRARMQGILVTDYASRYEEAIAQISAWIQDGSITFREHVLQGIEQAPGAIQLLYSGGNTGKLVIRI